MPSSAMQTVDKIARTPLSQILIFALVLTVFRVIVYLVVSKTPVHKRSGVFSVLSGVSDLFDSLIYAAVFIFMVIRPYFFQTFQIPSGSLHPTLQVGDFIGLNKAIYRYTEPKRGDLVVFHPPAYACSPDQLRENGDPAVDFVKRLIGLPGDLIEIKQGITHVNGKPLWEPYKHFSEPSSETTFRLYTVEETRNFPKQNWKLVKYKGNLIPLSYTEYNANSSMPQPHDSYLPPATNYRIDDPSEWAVARALPAEKIPAGYFLFIGDNRNNSFDGRYWGLIQRDSIIGRAEFIWLPLNRIGRPHYIDNGDQKAPDGIEAEGAH